MVRRSGLGILISAAVGTLFLVPDHGSAQDSLSDSACGILTVVSPLNDRELEVLKARAEQGDADATCNLGWIYTSGLGVPRDATAGIRWYLLAAELGHAETQYFFGVVGLSAGGGVLEDEVEAVRWYHLAAEQGHAGAQYSLGLAYDNGVGVPEDDAEALRWYRLAAEQGNPAAQDNLGRLYAYGEGVPEDDVEAVRLYRLAAEQGDATGQVNLGGQYYNGDGVPEDLVYAYMWWNLATAQGNEDARELKDIVEQRMTREQIAEAQRLSREWIETHPQDGATEG